MLRKNFIAFSLILFAICFSACEKEEPEGPHGVELITTLTYVLTPDGGGTSIELSFQDSDGDGGNAPVIVGGTLAANQTYSGALTLLNDSFTPAEDITDEIREEDEEHQFFFQTDIAGTSVSYDDQDSEGNPIGIASKLTTTDVGSGTLTIILRHEPNKSGSGVSDGDVSNAGGETDIEVTFDIDVQ